MKVRVYRNLNNGLFSVIDTSSRLVVGHCKALRMVGVKFIVNESGRQRVLSEKRKNVHAFVEGELLQALDFVAFKSRGLAVENLVSKKPNGERVRYNPYQMNSFQNESGSPVYACNACLVSPDGLFIFDERSL